MRMLLAYIIGKFHDKFDVLFYLVKEKLYCKFVSKLVVYWAEVKWSWKSKLQDQEIHSSIICLANLFGELDF